MNNQPFISICIPSYNRPETLGRLLLSIDSTDYDNIEIVICEDKSPRRNDIKNVVNEYKKTNTFNIVYVENKDNLGFDMNLRECINKASGKWIVFMGDDDVFMRGALDKLKNFLVENVDLGYVLRSYSVLQKNGSREIFRYFDGDIFFKPGFQSYISLFRKSVFVSGFSIRREYALKYFTKHFDGTLLFQLYLFAEVALRYPSAYFDTPITEQYEKELSPFFGNSESEKGLYTPGVVTIENSINFMRGFFKITSYIDAKHKLSSTKVIKRDFSKYSYPVLSIQRKRGIRIFLKYVKQLNKLGLNNTIYYYIYLVFLIVFRKRLCDNGIRMIKRILGRTPSL